MSIGLDKVNFSRLNYKHNNKVNDLIQNSNNTKSSDNKDLSSSLEALGGYGAADLNISFGGSPIKAAKKISDCCCFLETTRSRLTKSLNRTLTWLNENILYDVPSQNEIFLRCEKNNIEHSILFGNNNLITNSYSKADSIYRETYDLGADALLERSIIRKCKQTKNNDYLIEKYDPQTGKINFRMALYKDHQKGKLPLTLLETEKGSVCAKYDENGHITRIVKVNSDDTIENYVLKNGKIVQTKLTPAHDVAGDILIPTYVNKDIETNDADIWLTEYLEKSMYDLNGLNFFCF